MKASLGIGGPDKEGLEESPGAQTLKAKSYEKAKTVSVQFYTLFGHGHFQGGREGGGLDCSNSK